MCDRYIGEKEEEREGESGREEKGGREEGEKARGMRKEGEREGTRVIYPPIPTSQGC